MKKILLADDSITIQKVVELTFSDADYQVICVSNGAQALKKIGEVRPNIVLLDVIMPEKNGYEVCEQIKRSPGTAGIPVLLLTGTFEPFDRKRAELAGADGHLTKPFESQVLVAKVEELIARTPMVVSGEEAGDMDIISGGDVYRVEPGADRLRVAPGATPAPAGAADAAAAASALQAAPGFPPPATFPAPGGGDQPGGARATHPALAPPDPAAGGAYIGFADVTREEEGSIIPDRFSEPGGEPSSTMRLRRDALGAGDRPVPEQAAPGGPDGSASGVFTGAFETEFQLSEDDAVIAAAPSEGETADSSWMPPPEAPPAETWQSVEPDSAMAPPPAAPAPGAPSGVPPMAIGAPSAGLTAEAIDLIAERVVQRLSDRIVREIAWEVVPSVAEAVVRRRIRELEEKDPA